MMRFYIEGVGLYGPGLDGWAASRAVLTGAQAYADTPIPVPPCALLPANERRRAALIVKIALAVGAEAFAAAGRDPAGTAMVFASSGADGDTIHEILSVLASPQRELSPTRFHNSVHNAAAGYWSIATRSMAASTSLCCHDDSFAAGLLEAAVQAVTAKAHVALVAYDVQYPSPLGEARPLGAAFGVALILAPAQTDYSLACIDLACGAAARQGTVLAGPLEDLRQRTPAARSLPLLAALAAGEGTEIALNYLDNLQLSIKLTPCRGAA